MNFKNLTVNDMSSYTEKLPKAMYEKDIHKARVLHVHVLEWILHQLHRRFFQETSNYECFY